MKNKNDKRGKSPANFYDEIDIGPNKIYNEDCLWGMESPSYRKQLTE